jgi:hypothetical protein
MDPKTFVLFAKMDGGLDKYIDILRQILIAQHRYPEGTSEEQTSQIRSLTAKFKALLQAKARQERIQNIRKHNGRGTDNSSTCPTDYTSGRVCIRDILKEKVAGGGKRKNRSRKKEGYVESRLGKHVTNSWQTRFETGHHT